MTRDLNVVPVEEWTIEEIRRVIAADNDHVASEVERRIERLSARVAELESVACTHGVPMADSCDECGKIDNAQREANNELRAEVERLSRLLEEAHAEHDISDALLATERARADAAERRAEAFRESNTNCTNAYAIMQRRADRYEKALRRLVVECGSYNTARGRVEIHAGNMLDPSAQAVLEARAALAPEESYAEG